MARSRRPFLILLAIVAWSMLALQLFLSVRLAMGAGRSMIDGAIQCLSYFTVLSNLMVAIVVTAAASRDGSARFLARPNMMSATAVYIFIVGLIYALFLKSIWAPTGLQRVADVALHELIPISYVAYWLLFVPKGTLSRRDAFVWLSWAGAYLIYNLLYGGITGRYLYWFGDLPTLGYARVLANALMILAAFLVTGLLVVELDRRIGAPARAKADSAPV